MVTLPETVTSLSFEEVLTVFRMSASGLAWGCGRAGQGREGLDLLDQVVEGVAHLAGRVGVLHAERDLDVTSAPTLTETASDSVSGMSF